MLREWGGRTYAYGSNATLLAKAFAYDRRLGEVFSKSDEALNIQKYKRYKVNE
jgi:hypothetical protein